MEVPHAIEADGQLVCIEDARPPNVPANVREHLRETRNDDGDRAPTMASTKGCSRQPSRDSKRRRRQSEWDGERATRRWGDKAASPEIENVFFVWPSATGVQTRTSIRRQNRRHHRKAGPPWRKRRTWRAISAGRSLPPSRRDATVAGRTHGPRRAWCSGAMHDIAMRLKPFGK